MHIQTSARRFSSIHDHLPLDEHGFLLDPHYWSEHMACLITAMDGRGTLQAEHWSVIYYLREHYLTYGALPATSNLCKTLGLKKAQVKQLFGSCRAAWRTAGLPNPGEEALTYMN
ncbi:TusE/DsrC/DsvC family sulfur relay protein [Thiohalocapsa marina]|uniref:Sulfurtransferase n=1 Tax=Thiohalocapsa marina TaxID=424902 RepID=A0A5M8FLC3_9GAMM|nr:TusE/DsrC/DsvC family sulfur relay protein [Thiohalocapsa marina]KAA6181712.1 TusE/DsrC/DsvC family sulfur relay protein [Thiohalocapsa marina]